MTVPLLLIALGLLLALIEELNAHGRSLLAWSVVFLAVALLWGRLNP